VRSQANYPARRNQECDDLAQERYVGVPNAEIAESIENIEHLNWATPSAPADFRHP